MESAGEGYTALPITLSLCQASRRGVHSIPHHSQQVPAWQDRGTSIPHQPHQVPGQQDRGTQHSQPTSAGPTLPGQQDRGTQHSPPASDTSRRHLSSGMGGKELHTPCPSFGFPQSISSQEGTGGCSLPTAASTTLQHSHLQCYTNPTVITST